MRVCDLERSVEGAERYTTVWLSWELSLMNTFVDCDVFSEANTDDGEQGGTSAAALFWHCCVQWWTLMKAVSAFLGYTWLNRNLSYILFNLFFQPLKKPKLSLTCMKSIFEQNPTGNVWKYWTLMFSLAPWNEVFLPKPEKTFTWNWNSVLRRKFWSRVKDVLRILQKKKTFEGLAEVTRFKSKICRKIILKNC